MISCILIGGSPAREFGNFITDNSGGSVVIDNVFNSFSTDSADISRSLIRTKKLIWFINESLDIKGDLAVLDNCLSNSTYFKVEQIYIFGVKNDDTIEAEKIFRILMEEHDYSSYSIFLKDKLSSYSVMYTELMGTTDENKTVTARRRVYRATNGDPSKRGYDPEDYDKNISLVETNNAETYETIKDAAIKTETNKIIKDVREKAVPKIDLHVNNIDIDKVKYKQNIFIVCGKPKSGASRFSYQITKFLLDRKDSVNVIDITPNFGCTRFCINKMKISKDSVDRVLVNNEDLLTGKSYSNKELSIFSPSSLSNRGLMIGYLKYILSIPNRINNGYTVIDCCLDDIEEVLDLCGSRIGRVFITVQAVREELLIARKKINIIISRGIDSIVSLNQSINFDPSFSKITAVEGKILLPKAKFIGYIDFETEEADFTEILKVGDI